MKKRVELGRTLIRKIVSLLQKRQKRRIRMRKRNDLKLLLLRTYL